MLSRIRDKIGTAGLIVAIVALVAALGGGAYAAGLTGPEKNLIKQESKKFSKQFSKQFAKPGPAGNAGTNGKDGTNGTNGTDGTDGAAGKSVVVSGTAPGCTAGGVTVQVEGVSGSAKEVCNGVNGQTGFTSVLPPGKTETGAFGMTRVDENLPHAEFVTLSFAIPLPAGETYTINYIDSAGVAKMGNLSNCTGGSFAAPKANAGNLCLYANAASSGLLPSGGVGAPFGQAVSGVTLSMAVAAEGFQAGTWAITSKTA